VTGSWPRLAGGPAWLADRSLMTSAPGAHPLGALASRQPLACASTCRATTSIYPSMALGPLGLQEQASHGKDDGGCRMQQRNLNHVIAGNGNGSESNLVQIHIHLLIKKCYGRCCVEDQG